MRLRWKYALLICLLLNKQQRKILSDLLISHTLSMGLSHSDKSTENEKKKHVKSWGWVKKHKRRNFLLKQASSKALSNHVIWALSCDLSYHPEPKNVWHNKPIWDWFHLKKGQYSWETLTKQLFFFFFARGWMVTTSFQGQHSWKKHTDQPKRSQENR